VSGTRADFGPMARALVLAHADPRLEVSVCATGMHLAPGFGNTIEEIVASGLRICARIPVHLDGSTGAVMARAIGHELVGLTDALAAERPDLVLVLGDRGEMLAGALAAMHLGIPVAHVHGGERSGTVDEPVRHAISKLAHFHLVSTGGARERLIRMGEDGASIFVVGAPGLDGLRELVVRSRRELCADVGFDAARPVALVVFHPVVQEAARAGAQMTELMEALRERGTQALLMAPNSDAGGRAIREVLEQYSGGAGMRMVEHLARAHYVSWMAAADVMVGNSSSGIIEAATLGLPVVNVGSRQRGRERSANVADVGPERGEISRAIEEALRSGRREFRNVYGDGGASRRIVELLATLALDPSLLSKTNAY
jgi:GDP/UDP-N,N'-diacetylbacillosamine 2-epimerase (hydrolysing)